MMLTRERIEQLCHELDAHTTVPEEEILALRDLALQSLSQEAVRDEALEEAAKVCDALLAEGNAPSDRLIGFQLTAELIRALKREPNAAGGKDGQ